MTFSYFEVGSPLTKKLFASIHSYPDIHPSICIKILLLSTIYFQPHLLFTSATWHDHFMSFLQSINPIMDFSYMQDTFHTLPCLTANVWSM